AQISKKAKKHSNSLCSDSVKANGGRLHEIKNASDSKLGAKKKPAHPRRLVQETGYEERTE
ncbi:hypothetical protein LVK61_32545, partial [Escherichia coli]|nr:hypothetical protein [Escherichia coli]